MVQSVFKELKIVNVLSFGSSSHGDIQKLETLADLFLEEPDELLLYYRKML